MRQIRCGQDTGAGVRQSYRAHSIYKSQAGLMGLQIAEKN